MNVSNPIARMFAEAGSAAWLLAHGVGGGAHGLLRRDEAQAARLAGAMQTFVWRPLPAVVAMATLVGVVLGVVLTDVLRLARGEQVVGSMLSVIIVRDIVPVLLGVFAAGRVAVELAARMAGEERGVRALGEGRHVIAPTVAAVALAAPLHTIAAVGAIWLTIGLIVQQDALLPWPTYFELTVNLDTYRATPKGILKTLVFTLVATGAGAMVGSREVAEGARVARVTGAFTAALLAVLATVALWTALD